MSPPPVRVGEKVDRSRCRTVAGEGLVQGGGFRPLVYRLARRSRLDGCVRNDGGRVVIDLGRRQSAIEGFLAALRTEAPAPARALRVTSTWSGPAIDADSQSNADAAGRPPGADDGA